MSLLPINLAQLPARLAAGMYIAHSGIEKWNGDDAKADERSCVLRELLVAHPGLQDQAERVAIGLLTTVSVEQVPAEVESALT